MQQTIRYIVEQGRCVPAVEPARGRLKVLFMKSGRLAGTLVTRIGRIPPGEGYLRDLFLDKRAVPFLFRELVGRARRIVERRREQLASHMPGLQFLRLIRINGDHGVLFFKTEETSPLALDFQGLTSRSLARVVLELFQPEPRDAVDPSATGRRPALVLFQLDIADDPPSGLADEYAPLIIFRIRSGGNGPSVRREGAAWIVEAPAFTLLDVARIVADLAGSRPVLFLAGHAAGPLPAPPPDFAAQRAEGIRFVFPLVERTGCRGVRDAVFESFAHRADEAGHHGFLSPADVFIRQFPLADAATLGVIAFWCAGTDLTMFLPGRDRPFRSRAGLIRALLVCLNQAAVEGAGFARETGRVVLVRRPAPARLLAGTLAAGFHAARTVRREREVAMLWTGWFVRARRKFVISSLLGGKRLTFLRETLALSGYVAGLLLPFSRQEARPPMFGQGAPFQEVGLELAGGRVVWTKGQGEERGLFTTLFLDGRPAGCLAGPRYPSDEGNTPLAARLRDEYLLFHSRNFLRLVARRWFDEPGAADPRLGTAGERPPDPAMDVAGWPPMELILATRDRTDDLARLLDSVRELEAPIGVRVVDSNPSDNSTRDLCSARGVPYLLSPPPGKSRALNLGIRASRADVLLFTDDDAVAHPRWSRMLRAGLDGDRIECAVGLVLPWRVESHAQYLFERHMEEYEMGGLRRGFVGRDYTLPFSPFKAARIGTGVNMAIRRQAFDVFGFFAEALSPGTPARAGEEIDFFFRLLRRGRGIRYVPEAIVWHDHRRDMARLRRQLFSYGVSSAAFSLRWAFRERAPRALYFLVRWNILGMLIRSASVRPGYPRGLLLREALGSCWGPAAYAASLLRQAGYDARSGKRDD
jgi:GT2 family glycosyltransferase